MGRLLNLITPLHLKTHREYLPRMNDNKVDCMKMSREYGKDFFDGDRRYGYGGYKYDGRWEAVAKKIIDMYNLPDNARILDVGCGKGFLLYEFKKLLPKAHVTGFDISLYAIENGKEEVRKHLFCHKAQEPYPFRDNEFDLVVSITTLHNLEVFELKSALKELERVSREKFIVVEGYRNEKELFNLQCWALTCESFFRDREWEWLFGEFGYSGDYEFIYFD